MSRSLMEDNPIMNPRIKRGWRLEKMVWIPASGDALDINFPPYVELNPAGAVSIKMPAGAAANAGVCFLLSNISASTVTVVGSAGNAFTTAIVLLTLENTLIFCTGSTTEALSWRALATALST